MVDFKNNYPERYEETRESILKFMEDVRGSEFRTAELVDLPGFTASNMQVHEVLEDLAQETPIHEVDDATWVYTKGSLEDYK